jgi:hypothetical protein
MNPSNKLSLILRNLYAMNLKVKNGLLSKAVYVVNVVSTAKCYFCSVSFTKIFNQLYDSLFERAFDINITLLFKHTKLTG